MMNSMIMAKRDRWSEEKEIFREGVREEVAFELGLKGWFEI